MSEATSMEFVETPVKRPKAKSIATTAKKQKMRTADELSGATLAYLTFKRFIRFIWVNKVPIIVNLFLIENAYLVARVTGLIRG